MNKVLGELYHEEKLDLRLNLSAGPALTPFHIRLRSSPCESGRSSSSVTGDSSGSNPKLWSPTQTQISTGYSQCLNACVSLIIIINTQASNWPDRKQTCGFQVGCWQSAEAVLDFDPKEMWLSLLDCSPFLDPARVKNPETLYITWQKYDGNRRKKRKARDWQVTLELRKARMVSSSLVFCSTRPRWDMMLFSALPVEEPSVSSITERSQSILEKMLVTPVRRKDQILI